MKKRKICALLLAAVMVTGVLGGCGGNNDSNSASNTNTNTNDSASASNDDASSAGDADTSGDTSTPANNGEVVTLRFFNADANQDDPWTDPVAQVLTEKTGVKLELERPIGGNDESESVALMIAEQNYPDIIFAKGSAGSLIDAGALIDMTDLIEQYGPNIKKLYGDEFGKLRESKDDPAIYQLSAYNVGGTKYKDLSLIHI